MKGRRSGGKPVARIEVKTLNPEYLPFSMLKMLDGVECVEQPGAAS